MDLDVFAAQRDEELRTWAELLRPHADDFFDGDTRGLLAAARDAYAAIYAEALGSNSPKWATHRKVIRESLAKTSTVGEDADVERLTQWLATYLVNAATYDAADPGMEKTWVTMRDEDVRDLHRPLEGFTVGLREGFDVGTVKMLYPGQPIGPLEGWINCRCVLAVGVEEEVVTAAVPEAMPDEEVVPAPEPGDTEEPADGEMWDDDAVRDEPVPVYGVLAPEGVASGDGRKFSEEALSWRDLPIPLMYQPTNMGGHDGSVVAGQISRIERDGNLLRWWGRLADNVEADIVTGLVAEGHLNGISVDVDSVELAADQMEDEPTEVEFAKGRISAATIVAIPAFSEAFIAIGDGPVPVDADAPSFEGEPMVEQDEPDIEGTEFGERQGIGGYPIENCGDLRNAIQAIGRARPEDRDRTIAHIRSEKKRLGCPEVELPDTWAADTDAFRRGPGWVTNPKATSRIHHYWVRGEGAAKIRWGTPGDFTRAVRYLRKYISPPFLNRTAAQWHHDALGYWPGQKGMPGNPPLAADTEEAAMVAAVSFTRAERPVLPAEWFTDPGLDAPSPITVTDDGRVFGHLATWGTCHIGIQDACVTAPRSKSAYAYFRTGAVMTEDGEVAVGGLTMDTGHAPLSARARPAAAHYDNTGTVVADVAAGEDIHGIWVAGAMRPGADADTIARFRASALSGDWRKIAGALELVGALAVNVPGFPIPRASLAASAAEGQTALVAAGVVPLDELSIRRNTVMAEQRALRAAKVLTEMGV